MLEQNNNPSRRHGLSISGFCVALMLFACGGEETLPADITDVNDIRVRAADAKKSPRNRTQTMAPFQVTLIWRRLQVQRTKKF